MVPNVFPTKTQRCFFNVMFIKSSTKTQPKRNVGFFIVMFIKLSLYDYYMNKYIIL